MSEDSPIAGTPRPAGTAQSSTSRMSLRGKRKRADVSALPSVSVSVTELFPSLQSATTSATSSTSVTTSLAGLDAASANDSATTVTSAANVNGGGPSASTGANLFVELSSLLESDTVGTKRRRGRPRRFSPSESSFAEVRKEVKEEASIFDVADAYIQAPIPSKMAEAENIDEPTVTLPVSNRSTKIPKEEEQDSRRKSSAVVSSKLLKVGSLEQESSSVSATVDGPPVLLSMLRNPIADQCTADASLPSTSTKSATSTSARDSSSPSPSGSPSSSGSGSLDMFTKPSECRTAQLIVRGKTLYVNPHALVEHSTIMANILEKSGPKCKLQLDFLTHFDVQTTLRLFCRNPKTGQRERLIDPNNKTQTKRKVDALRNCSVFVAGLNDIVECDDVSQSFSATSPEAFGDWLVPSRYRTFELIPMDSRAVFVNMNLIKEYSPVLADSPAIAYDFCMLPQFTSAELVVALNVLFRNPRTSRFYGITADNIEILYKCAGLFECLRPLCDTFTKEACLDAMIKADWSKLKALLLIQASRRKCEQPNRVLLTEIITSAAKLLGRSASSTGVLETLQFEGIADVPMGIGTALMIALTEARFGASQFFAPRLIM